MNLLLEKLETPNSWVNDIVIDEYFNLIQNNPKNKFNCVCFSSFFYTSAQRCESNALRILQKNNFHVFDLVLIPIFIVNHWALISINNISSSISYYDSIYKKNSSVLQKVHKIVQSATSEKEWKCVNLVNIPQQENSDDCGIYTSQFATLLAMGLPLNFNQQQISAIRRTMAESLRTKELRVHGITNNEIKESITKANTSNSRIFLCPYFCGYKNKYRCRVISHMNPKVNGKGLMETPSCKSRRSKEKLSQLKKPSSLDPIQQFV